MTEPSEQALPFSEAAREAAERVVTAMARENEGYVGPYDEWLPQTLAAALDADPRAKAFLELARLSNEELVERVADLLFWAEPWVIEGYQPPTTPEDAQQLARAVLAALGLPVDEQETTG